MSGPSVIVVGAGIVGCTVAYELAKAGATVRVVEPRAIGQGATRASAGILAPYIEGHGSTPLRRLGKRSLDLYDDFIVRIRADSGHDVPYERLGTLELAFSDADVTRVKEVARAAQEQGIAAHWITPGDFDDYEPVSPEAIGALLIPIHGFVGVTALTRAAAAAAERFGATFTTNTGAIRVFSTPDGSVGVESSTELWHSDRVVLAAGSWSSMITVEDADRVPVVPIRGQLIQLQSRPGFIRRVVWGPDGYLVPWPDGSVLVGSTVEDVGFDESHTEEAVAKLKAAAIRLVPELASAPLSSVRTGLRPKSADDLPILGPSKAVPGLIYATAHYRNGVLFTPLTMQLVGDLIFDRAADPALGDLSPSRFSSVRL